MQAVSLGTARARSPIMSLPRLSALLMVLTIIAGVIDAISVLGLGRVFTANMTGNTVFLGFSPVCPGSHRSGLWQPSPPFSLVLSSVDGSACISTARDVAGFFRAAVRPIAA